MNTTKVSPRVGEVPVVRDFLNVFLDELLGLYTGKLTLRLSQFWV